MSATTAGLEADGEVPAEGYVLMNSATDVAAPTSDAVTLAVNGSVCVLDDQVATSWAAAEVSGVVACCARGSPTRRRPRSSPA